MDNCNNTRKMAVLVTANVTTRVVVDAPNGVIDDDAYEKALELAKYRLIGNLMNDYHDCIEDVRKGKDMPFDPNNEKLTIKIDIKL